MRDDSGPCASGLLFVDVGCDLHAHDLVGILHHAALRIALLDRVDIFHARYDLAEERVLAIEIRRRREADEELAVGAIGTRRTRHADAAADEMRLTELGLDILARAAHAGAGGIAGLRHEARNHAMEEDAVIEALARELLD